MLPPWQTSVYASQTLDLASGDIDALRRGVGLSLSLLDGRLNLRDEPPFSYNAPNVPACRLNDQLVACRCRYRHNSAAKGDY